MFGNPRGEVRSCFQCKRIHDIRRGTFVVCACGYIVKSKNYNPKKMKEYLDEANKDV